MSKNSILASNSRLREDLYERDYYTWALKQARALQARRIEELDWENLAEEMADLGRSEARGLKSQLARLLAHLLKWQLQPARRTNSWRGSIRGARDAIRELLGESPGLKPRLPELFERAYRAGVNQAVEETNLGRIQIPCSFSLDLRGGDERRFLAACRDNSPSSAQKQKSEELSSRSDGMSSRALSNFGPISGPARPTA